MGGGGGEDFPCNYTSLVAKPAVLPQGISLLIKAKDIVAKYFICCMWSKAGRNKSLEQVRGPALRKA